LPVNIHLLGNSGSGKTTTAEYLIVGLRSRNIRTAYLKNIPHDDVAFDMAGKDTERALRNGAVLSVGRARSATFMTFGSSLELKSIIEMTKAICDVCLIEGFQDEIKEIRISLSIALKQDSNRSGLRRIFIDNGDGSSAEFESSSSFQEAISYVIQRIENILQSMS
jgi:molybdopterin-guanine dinucleotide biosynthesis protein MobB